MFQSPIQNYEITSYLLCRKYGFQELEYYYLHHVTNGLDNQSIPLEMVDIILDMPTFGAMAACIQSC